MTAYVVTSDVHLEDAHGPLFQQWVHAIESALERVSDPTRTILVLGDLWDVYIEGHSFFRGEYYAPFWNQVNDWNSRGISFHWYEGNHDLYREEANHLFQSGRTLFHVSHGDRLNLKDRSYLRLKRILHCSGVRFLAQHLPGAWVDRIGKKMRTASHEDWIKEKPWTWDDYVEEIKNIAPALKDAGAQLMIFGHCHWKKDERIEGIRVINLGTFPEDRSVFVVDNERQFWVTLGT